MKGNNILNVIKIALILPEKGWCLIDTKETRENIFQVLTSLTHREELVVVFRCVCGMTLNEIGMVFGVTRSRIFQIEARAYRKLRHPSRSKRFNKFVRYTS